MAKKAFDPMRYPVVTRVVDGYLEVSQPDFGIYRYKKQWNTLKTAEDIGSLVLDIMNETIRLYMEADEEVPEPSKPKVVFPRDSSPRLTVGEVARALKTSVDTVRRLCTDGKLHPIITRGGHRKFERSEIESLMQSTPSPTPKVPKTEKTEIDSLKDSLRRRDFELSRQHEMSKKMETENQTLKGQLRNQEFQIEALRRTAQELRAKAEVAEANMASLQTRAPEKESPRVLRRSHSTDILV